MFKTTIFSPALDPDCDIVVRTFFNEEKNIWETTVSTGDVLNSDENGSSLTVLDRRRNISLTRAMNDHDDLVWHWTCGGQ